MNPPFTLPEAPVDGLEVTWYKVDPYWTDRKDYIISKVRAVYHINTKWDDFSPNNKGGADLEDCWMVYKGNNSSADGRILTWNGVASAKFVWENTFATLGEAKLKAIEYCTNQVGHLYNKIAEVNDTLVYLHEGE